MWLHYPSFTPGVYAAAAANALAGNVREVQVIVKNLMDQRAAASISDFNNSLPGGHMPPALEKDDKL